MAPMFNVTCLFFLSCLSAVVLKAHATTSMLVPSEHTRTPQTIYISSTVGGISHIDWVLEIGQVLHERGHQVSFVTTEPNIKYTKKYPDIHTISMGYPDSNIQFRQFFDTENPFSTDVVASYVQYTYDTMEKDYNTYIEVFSSANVSTVLCDQVALPCMDAAKTLDIPLFIYMTMSIAEDMSVPFIDQLELGQLSTTLHQSLWQRLYTRYYLAPRYALWYRPAAQAIHNVRRKLGIKSWNAFSRHSGAVKLVNGFWGFESPRPVGPFVEYVGPVMNRYYDALPDTLVQFMDRHSCIVYLAFGQMYAPNRREFVNLLTGLLEAYERGYLDGVIWSLSEEARASYPETVQTPTRRTVYNTSDLFAGKHSSIRFQSWVPQFAVLNHANCKLFISHGGASSVHESIYNAVPMLVHPYASDQPANADKLTLAGIALTIDRKISSARDIVGMLRKLLITQRAEFEYHSKRMQTLAKVRQGRKQYAADVIEEVMYTTDGKSNIWYRHEAARDMSWWKESNWDVDMLAGTLLLAGVALFMRIVGAYLLSRGTLIHRVYQKGLRRGRPENLCSEKTE